MAPFKLKFRMGSSSRSTSLETAAARLASTSDTSSTSTIDSQFHSLGSLNNDQRNLLIEVDNDDHIGYSNPAIMHNLIESEEHLENAVPQNEAPQCETCLEGNVHDCHSNLPAESTRSPSEEEFFSDNDSDDDPNGNKSNANLANNSVTNNEQNLENTSETDSMYTADNGANNDRECDSHNNHQQVIPNTISNKASKKIYKEVSRQWGITCEMSEHCRCMDCQSQYFQCDYQDYQELDNLDAGDGGLGASAPVFINGLHHGTSCSIL